MFDFSTDLCRRRNITMFLCVDIACDIGDLAVAAHYLARNGVPFDIAHRVLLHPGRRRSANQ